MMPDATSLRQQTVVIKIGGSVLTKPAAYRRIARLLADRWAEHPAERILAVVSAQEGTTDRLLASACEIVSDPDPCTLDLLWSTGELRSVALLGLALQALGVRAAAANVHQMGLLYEATDRSTPDAPRWCWRGRRVRPLRLHVLLASADIVVAPGFLARAAGDRVTSLGRGGSDLSAVLLAAAIDARACELVKDVPGYFDTDPRVAPDAVPIAALGYERAIEMARQGCGLVQLDALEAARDLGVRLFVRDVNGTGTTVGAQVPIVARAGAWEAGHEDTKNATTN